MATKGSRSGGIRVQCWPLLIAAGLTAAACVLHVAIIVGGPAWYRFFGAGEHMARLAARGAVMPAILTAGIALMLGICTLYALSGAGLLSVRLPLLRPVLGLIAAVFLARGLLGIPVVLMAAARQPPPVYAVELRGRMTFMTVTSLVSLALGGLFALGALRGRPGAQRRDHTPASDA